MRYALAALTAVLASVWLSGCGGQKKMGPSAPASSRGALCKAKAAADVDAKSEARPATGWSHASPAATEDASAPRSKPARAPLRTPPRTSPAVRAPSERDTAAPRDEPRPADPPPARERRDRPVTPRDRSIQSGTLTAGSFDDHEHFEDFRSFLSEAMQGDAGEVLPRLAIGRRVMIHVTAGGGRPVGDARVVVRPVDPQQRGSSQPRANGPALLDARTGSDGRALFLTGLDGGRADAYRVSVYAPDSGQPVTRVMRVDGQPWRIALPDTAPRLPRRLDLALVVDTTGSMGDELEYLKVEIDSIAAAVHRMFPGVDQRYALIVYRDDGDQYVTRSLDFTGSLEDFRRTLSDQQASGGGDYPEAVHLALAQAGKLSWRDRGTARVMFLVGDAPPHDRFAGDALAAVGGLRSRGVRVFPVAASGAKQKAEFVMRTTAFLTLGQYLFLTDHSGVGNPHARPHVPSYQVERLDKLMIRMIASELSGKRLAPGEVIAIESGASPGELPIEPEQQQTGHPAPGASQARASFGMPSWVFLAAAILLLCLVDAAVDRAGGKQR